MFGAQCVVLAIDAKARSGVRPERLAARSIRCRHGWEAYLAGGRTPTGRDVVEWAREAVERGAGEILLTSMDRDGTSDGYDLALTRAVSEAVSVPVIASGGAGELEHLAQALRAGADAVLCASIFHYGQHTIAEAKAHLAAAGIAVRDRSADRGDGGQTADADVPMATARWCSSVCAGCPAAASCSAGRGTARTSSWSAAPCATSCSDAAARAGRGGGRRLAPHWRAVRPRARGGRRRSRSTSTSASAPRIIEWDGGRIDIASGAARPTRRRARCPRSRRARSRRTWRAGTSRSTRSPLPSAARAGRAVRGAARA